MIVTIIISIDLCPVVKTFRLSLQTDTGIIEASWLLFICFCWNLGPPLNPLIEKNNLNKCVDSYVCHISVLKL